MPTGFFVNPENHVPYLEEMKQTYAKKHGSVLDKVSVLQPGTLLRLIIGANASQQIHDTPLYSALLSAVRTIKEKHRVLKPERIAQRCFPKFVDEGMTNIESYALKEPSLVSFLNGVLNFVVPKDLLSSQQRTILTEFIAQRLMIWHSGTKFLASNETYPVLEYAVLEKEVKRNLDKIWALCNNDKFLAEEMLEGISAGFTHFLALYALHTLRNQTKVGLNGDRASFYSLPIYNKIKEKLQTIEHANTSTFSQCSSLTGDQTGQSEADLSKLTHPEIRQDENVMTSAQVNSTSVAAGSIPQNDSLSAQNGTKDAELPRDNATIRSGSIVEEVNPLPLKRIKLEPGVVTSPPLKMFPRDRPPDDIPVYDYTKVKREKFDVKSRMETESRISNSTSSNHVSGSGSAHVDEWDEVLRCINADPAVPTQYKVMFRCLVMSNRDLRDHNKILRSQLEKS
ncbi:unnamed protein product [Cylicocyclus nassatus]|uniref:Uncharacterized protein n=1 Tax=Cylicocyclus nassatus TaxID=53992 RepID=A0AA36GMM9_CYLNA|nr:unnamed protein product [Cylicocyclus nassatus]